jgi:hypothetical protein
MVTASHYIEFYGLARFPVSLKTITTQAIIIISLFAPISIAYAAEDTIRGSTAATMPHPELAPTGIHHGGFILLPGIVYSLNYTDNVFATESNTESGNISQLIPSISANSNWNKHALNFSAFALKSVNHKFSSEDYTDWEVQADGLIDISHKSSLSLGASTGVDHVPRGTPDDTRGVEPTEYDRTSIFSRYSHRTGRVVSAINLNIMRKEYQDADAIRLGIPVTLDLSDRDRTESRLKLRIGYRYIANQQVFVSVEGFDRDYDNRRSLSGRDQSSTGVKVLLGSSFDYHGILLGEVAMGYRTQDYKQPSEDIHEPVVEAGVRWNVTDLSTVNFNLTHRVLESIDLFFSGYTSTKASVGLDHELRRNLVLDLEVGYTRNDYVGIDPAERTDDIYHIAAGSRYRMNRNLFFNTRYTHYERASDLEFGPAESSQFDFSQNLISFQLQAQF